MCFYLCHSFITKKAPQKLKSFLENVKVNFMELLSVLPQRVLQFLL